MDPQMTTPRRNSSDRPAAVSEPIDRLLDIKQVVPMAGVQRSALNEWSKDGRFPAPIRLSARCTRWKLSEVQAWIAAQGKPQ